MRHSATRGPIAPGACWAGALLVSLSLVACGSGHEQRSVTAATRAPERPTPAPPSDEVRREDARADARADLSVSPRPAEPRDPALAPWLALCGAGDGALHEVAQEIAERVASGHPPPEPEWTVERLRHWGAPYVGPRVWSARFAAAADSGDAELRLERWAQRRARGVLRCGIAEVVEDGDSRTVALVQVDARADLEPLPTRGAVGSWIDLAARLSVPATGTAAVLLPPEGAPRALVLDERGERLSARFSLDRPGLWLVQILANDEGGALPVLEAELFAGDGTPEPRSSLEVPGERAAAADAPAAQALLSMINEARRVSGVPPLAPDRTLTTLAEEHAGELLRRGAVTHDAGEGSPERRIEAAGVTARRVGENVARAPSVLRVYRALWASPSHRGNLLYPHFVRVGIGVRAGTDGMLHASLLFADAP